MKKLIFVLLGLAFIYFVCTYAYKILTISSISPPIKQYEYLGSTNQLISDIRKYSSTNSNVSFKINDTIGTNESGYAIEMDIVMRSSEHAVTYNLMCEKNDNVSLKTKIKLLGAYDKIGNVGGYIKEAKGVKELVGYFESEFLIPLENNQNIKIVPL